MKIKTHQKPDKNGMINTSDNIHVASFNLDRVNTKSLGNETKYNFFFAKNGNDKQVQGDAVDAIFRLRLLEQRWI